MRAVLTENRFSSDEWIFEPKLDGVRLITYRRGKTIRLYTRNRLLANSRYPELVAAMLKQTPQSFIVDGEVVGFKPGTSLSSFAQIQKRLRVDNPSARLVKEVPVTYFLFDLLHLNGQDRRSRPLYERKMLLQRAFRFDDKVRFLTHLQSQGTTYYKAACRLGWEGLMAKRMNSRYRSARSPDWLKFKCLKAQEMVVGGYTDPEGTRRHFGALLLGYHEGEKLRFAGKVGTGFDGRDLADIHNKLRSLTTERSPFVSVDIGTRGLHWVKPELVAQIGFSDWTADGKLRHPRFAGLRDDKLARDVKREKARQSR